MITWFELAASHARHRPLRTAVTVCGVAAAVAALFSLLGFERGYRTQVRLELERLGAHILIVPKGCPYDAASMALHGANWPCYLKAAYLREVLAVPGVATAAPVLMSANFGPAGEQTVYLGVETNYLELKRNWKMDGHFPARDGEVLLGASVAGRCHWRIGQEVSLPGVRDFRAVVSGVLKEGQSAEDSFVFLRLADAQRWLGHPDELTHIFVRLSDPTKMDAVAAQLRGCDAGLFMNVVPLAHLFRTIEQMVRSTRFLLSCIAAVALIAAGSGLSSTLLIAVAERTAQIGVMRAIGASRLDIFRLFWIETLELSAAGAVAGLAGAWWLSRAVEAWVRLQLPFSPEGTIMKWEWSLAAFCFGTALVLGTAAGAIPAWRAAVLPPNMAIRPGGSAA